ncbi:SRPBCC family protein [Lysobacter sp. CA199]|uniref:SRPBCC family protein n=1 Tax=Lysobacter sp. CA199 TaxID=3455608 RepID=UPI003F8D8996
MRLTLTAERRIAAAPEAVFALALDSERFPALFDGYGPIPGLKRITPLAPAAVGSLRALENRDGSKLMERITALEPPHRHAYVLSGMRPPLAWLAREGHAQWSFESERDGSGESTRVVWRYEFELTSALAWPLAAPLLHGFMRKAMQRCLDRMAHTLEAAWRRERG